MADPLRDANLIFLEPERGEAEGEEGINRFVGVPGFWSISAESESDNEALLTVGVVKKISSSSVSIVCCLINTLGGID